MRGFKDKVTPGSTDNVFIIPIDEWCRHQFLIGAGGVGLKTE